MKAVIYAGYSSDSQREESIEGQLRECTAFAEKNGITGLRHYIDRAYSAKTDNRPEFQSMIKDSGKRLFDTAGPISAARAAQAARERCIITTSVCRSRRSAPSATRSPSGKNGSRIWWSVKP